MPPPDSTDGSLPHAGAAQAGWGGAEEGRLTRVSTMGASSLCMQRAFSE